MTQTDETPDKEDSNEIHELSELEPMWKRIAQLVGDKELAAHTIDCTQSVAAHLQVEW